MNRSDQTPTLLVFTLGPEGESLRRRLLPPSLRAAETLLHRNNLETALQAGRRAGFRLVVAAPRPLELPPAIEQVQQRGCTFVERLRSTIDEIQQRYSGAPLVVVGTDSPDLDARHLCEAVSWLEDNPLGVVLGPAKDGGFYLLASRQPLDTALATARWCTSDTRRTLQASLQRQGRPIKLLDALVDLDRPADLEAWLSRSSLSSPAGWIGRLLIALLTLCRRPLSPLAAHIPEIACTDPISGRGPPL